MNVSVRFLTATALATLASSALPLAAQSATPSNAQDVPAAIAPVGLAPSVLTGLGDRAALVDPAQATTGDSSQTSAARGPTLVSARVASHAIVSATRNAPPVLQNRTSNRNALALMIVGGAALVIGAVIGDDAGTLVMLGGAGIGLYGLYLFLT